MSGTRAGEPMSDAAAQRASEVLRGVANVLDRQHPSAPAHADLAESMSRRLRHLASGLAPSSTPPDPADTPTDPTAAGLVWLLRNTAPATPPHDHRRAPATERP